MPAPIRLLQDMDVTGKTVICRVDFNVPMQQGRVRDRTRIERQRITIDYLLEQNAKIILLSHFSRPKGEFVRDMSLAPLMDTIAEIYQGYSTSFGVDCIGDPALSAVKELNNGEILLMENVRFHNEEETNDTEFSKALASLGDIFVNDAFSCSHRPHSSIVGITEHVPSAAGLLLQEELHQLEKVLNTPDQPICAIVGGSKVSTKFDLLESLIDRCATLVIGGAMANTFLKAKGYPVGKSRYEAELTDAAGKLLEQANAKQCHVILPTDVVVANNLQAGEPCRVIPAHEIEKEHMALDIGPETVHRIANALIQSRTVVWNGPLGAFETRPFDVASVSIARVIASQTSQGKLTSIAGGGDVVATLGISGLINELTYVSTAGGAFLEWLEGRKLPGIEVLRQT